jgi:hypothetical protein
MNFAAAVVMASMPVVVGALAPSDFLIESLPGLDAKLNFSQYAGYMPINDGNGTEIFFWFVESQSDPAKDPLALWMNGGPGASSVGYGFWTEHGPFRLAADGNGSYVPQLYEYSWNTVANVLYIEVRSLARCCSLAVAAVAPATFLEAEITLLRTVECVQTSLSQVMGTLPLIFCQQMCCDRLLSLLLIFCCRRRRHRRRRRRPHCYCGCRLPLDNRPLLGLASASPRTRPST